MRTEGLIDEISQDIRAAAETGLPQKAEEFRKACGEIYISEKVNA